MLLVTEYFTSMYYFFEIYFLPEWNIKPYVKNIKNNVNKQSKWEMKALYACFKLCISFHIQKKIQRTLKGPIFCTKSANGGKWH